MKIRGNDHVQKLNSVSEFSELLNSVIHQLLSGGYIALVAGSFQISDLVWPSAIWEDCIWFICIL